MNRHILRLSCALLCGLLFFTCMAFPLRAASEDISIPPVYPAGYVPLEETLQKLNQVFASADLVTTRLESEEARLSNSLRQVRVTEGLMKELRELFTGGDLTRLSEPMRGISGDYSTAMLQFRNNNTFAILEVFSAGERGKNAHADKTVIWLQLGDEIAHYTAPAAFYERMNALLNSYTFDKTISVQGNAAALTLPDENASNLFDAFELGDLLVLCRGNERITRVDLIRPADRSVAASIVSQNPVDRVEPLPGGTGVRLYTAREMRDYGIDGALKHELGLNDAVKGLLSSQTNSFCERDGAILFVGARGVYYMSGPQAAPKLVLPNAPLTEMLADRLPKDMPSELSPNYIYPRLLNGGNTAVVSIELPGSQSGLAGISILDLKTGKIAHHTDLFAAMMAMVSYPDDKTVVAQGNGVTRIDLSTGARSRAEVDALDTSTADGLHFARMTLGRNAEGYPTNSLVTFRAGENGQHRLISTGGGLSIAAVTERYVVSTGEIDKGRYWFLTDCDQKAKQPLTLRPRKAEIGFERGRIQIFLKNGSGEPVTVDQAFIVEKKSPTGWTVLKNDGGEAFGLDRPDIQFPVEPGEERMIGAFIGGLRGKEKTIPAGTYRITLTAGGAPVLTEFVVRNGLEPEDTSEYALEAVLPVVTGKEESLEYRVINKTGQEIGFGMGEWLERNENGEWKAVSQLENLPVLAMATLCPPHQSVKDVMTLKRRYALPLSPGEYRIVKFLGYEDRFYAPFTVS